jgi:hypothetical protein
MSESTARELGDFIYVDELVTSKRVPASYCKESLFLSAKKFERLVLAQYGQRALPTIKQNHEVSSVCGARRSGDPASLGKSGSGSPMVDPSRSPSTPGGVLAGREGNTARGRATFIDRIMLEFRDRTSPVPRPLFEEITRVPVRLIQRSRPDWLAVAPRPPR